MLTFQELISVPLFSKATIVGGWKGKERSFNHIDLFSTEIQNSTLVLLPIEEYSILPDCVANPSIQGVILFGDRHIHIASQLVKKIDEREKPVFIVSSNYQLILKTINDMIQLKTLGQFSFIWEGMTDYWLNLIHEKGVQQMVERLRFFVHESLLLLKSDFTPYFTDGNKILATALKNIRNLYYEQIKKNEGWSMVQVEEHHYLLFPIKINNEILGFIILEEQPGMMLDTCIEIVSHAIPAIGTSLKKEEEILQTHQLYKDYFLHNLLYNNIESELELVELGKQWGWDFAKPAQLMVCRLQPLVDRSIPNNEMNEIIGIIRSTISASFLTSLTHHFQGDIVIIIFDSFERNMKERKETMLQLAEKISHGIENRYSDITCQIGLGRHYSTNMLLYKSYYEAKVALEMRKYEIHPRSILHFEDIGIARLLSNIQNNILHEYYAEILGGLFEQEHSDDHLTTLEVFFRNNGDISKTAEQLFIHPNTLRKRIKRIETIIDCDLNQIEDQVKILVALKIMKMLN